MSVQCKRGRAGEGRTLYRLHAAHAHELDDVGRRAEGHITHEGVHLREGRGGEGARELGPPGCLEGEGHFVYHPTSCGLGLVGADDDDTCTVVGRQADVVGLLHPPVRDQVGRVLHERADRGEGCVGHVV